MNIGIFCSANSSVSAAFFKAAEALAQWIGEKGHSIVWGGCSLGLMETVGRSFLKSRTSGRLTGVVPRIIEEKGKTFSPMDSVIYCSNLSERKDIIVENSDILVALPGGIGTLDEIFTVVSSATIGYHSKKIILYNIEGFWNPLANLLDHLEKENMIRGNYRDRIIFCSTLEEFSSLL
ncbi:MAG: TIGR00730 family Rossman fold protein [Bacteroidales bacterium]|nr:TIGR00730 family Rossman fold protein [Bacteroidales bacterium]